MAAGAPAVRNSPPVAEVAQPRQSCARQRPRRTRRADMKIGIIGAGNIGGNLTRRFTAVGHDVSVANSRGPETLKALAEETGATPSASRTRRAAPRSWWSPFPSRRCRTCRPACSTGRPRASW